MESTSEQFVRIFQPGIPAEGTRSLFAELEGSRRVFTKALTSGIAIVAIGMLIAWSISSFWGNSMTGEESANALFVRDQLFGDLIGASDINGLPALVSPDAELQLPGGALTGPDGMRALVQEMYRVESTSSLTLLDVAAQGDLVLATWTIDEPESSSLLGFDSQEEVDGFVSGQMLLVMDDGQIAGMTMTTWPS